LTVGECSLNAGGEVLMSHNTTEAEPAVSESPRLRWVRCLARSSRPILPQGAVCQPPQNRFCGRSFILSVGLQVRNGLGEFLSVVAVYDRSDLSVSIDHELGGNGREIIGAQRDAMDGVFA